MTNQNPAITAEEFANFDAAIAAYKQGHAIGQTADPCASDFKAAWNHCDDLGIARDSAKCNMFTSGFLDAMRQAGHC